MTGADLVAALELPASARVDQRIPKKMLIEKGAATAADKRRITDGVEEIRWVAALKPATIGVPEFRDDVREYLEIAVLALTLRAAVGMDRLAELVHRAIPYPALVIIDEPSRVSLSLGHKRWSQSEAGDVVLDGELTVGEIDEGSGDVLQRALLEALPLAKQPGATLYTLYEGWLGVILAWQAGGITGKFVAPTSVEDGRARRDAIRICIELESHIAALRAAAERERQIARQVDLNLELKRLEADYSAARARLEPQSTT